MTDYPGLYVNTVRNAALEAIRDLDRSGDPRATRLKRITGRPISFWIESPGSIDGLKDIVIDAAGKRQTPIFTIYLIPGRDNGGFSSGGANDREDYLRRIDRIAAMLAPLPGIIILEPDALAHAADFSPAARKERLDLLFEAVIRLKRSQPGHAIYMDAGHARWLSPRVAADLLSEAGIRKADGFALNVSNFVPMAETTAYGEKISSRLDGTRFVIDTSRNGALTPPASPFDPPGRRLGPEPSTQTGHPLIDAYLWIKVPGESDGGPGAPPAGTFWPEYAYALLGGA